MLFVSLVYCIFVFKEKKSNVFYNNWEPKSVSVTGGDDERLLWEISVTWVQQIV